MLSFAYANLNNHKRRIASRYRAACNRPKHTLMQEKYGNIINNNNAINIEGRGYYTIQYALNKFKKMQEHYKQYYD